MIDKIDLKSAFNPSDLVGKSFEGAKKLCEDSGYALRITQKDGENLMCTCDFRINRINVSVVNGNVSKFHDIG